MLYPIISPFVRVGDFDFDNILGVGGNTAAMTSADGCGRICVGDDNNIFFGEDSDVEGDIESFFGEGDVVVQGAIENIL